MTTPYVGAPVVVIVDASHNNGSPLAAATITGLNEDGTVNVRVWYDVPPRFMHRHAREHLAGIQFHDTSDPAEAGRHGLHGAFWPAALPQDQLDLSIIIENQEKIMSAQEDVNNAVSAIQSIASDLTSAASNISAEVATLNQELAAAGNATVDTSQLNAAVTALQEAQKAVDAIEPVNPAPVTPEPAAPAEGTAGSTVAAGDSGSAA